MTIACIELLQPYINTPGTYILRNFMSRENEFCISATGKLGRSISHHMCHVGPDGTITVDGKATGCTTFQPVLQLLSSPQPWFATRLRQGISKTAQIVKTTEQAAEKPDLESCRYYHPNGSGPQAARKVPASWPTPSPYSVLLPVGLFKVRGLHNGLFMFVPFKDGQTVLSVAFKNNVTHHLVGFTPETKTFTVNKKQTTAATLDELVQFLSKKSEWWPIALVEGIAADEASMPKTVAEPTTAMEPAVPTATASVTASASDETPEPTISAVEASTYEPMSTPEAVSEPPSSTAADQNAPGTLGDYYHATLSNKEGDSKLITSI